MSGLVSAPPTTPEDMLSTNEILLCKNTPLLSLPRTFSVSMSVTSEILYRFRSS